MEEEEFIVKLKQQDIFIIDSEQIKFRTFLIPSNVIVSVIEDISFERRLEGIFIIEPFQVNYVEGEYLDLGGLEVWAYYSDGDQEEVTWDCTVNPSDGTFLDTPGALTVDISYEENGVTVYTDFDVYVEPIPVYPINLEYNYDSNLILHFTETEDQEAPIKNWNFDDSEYILEIMGEEGP